jgi:hypothetical protein
LVRRSGVGNDFEQVLDTSAPNRRTDPEFREMRPDLVDNGSLLADQKMARTKKRRQLCCSTVLIDTNRMLRLVTARKSPQRRCYRSFAA